MGQIRKVRKVKINQKTIEAEDLRRKVSRKLVELGFKRTRQFNKAQLYEAWDINDGYIYQVWVKGKKNKTTIDGYAFLKNPYVWKYNISGDQAATYIQNIVNYCVEESHRNKELAEYVRSRYRYHHMGIRK